MPLGQMPVGEEQSLDQNTRQIHKGGPPWMCGQHNVRAFTGDNAGQNTKDTHPIPGQKWKFRPRRESNPGRRVERQGLVITITTNNNNDNDDDYDNDYIYYHY